MTFTDIVTEITDRLNLTSTQAITRVGRSINERYREMASSVGISGTIERRVISASTTIGNRNLVFMCQKIMSVFNPAFVPPFVLGEVDFDELRNQIVGTDPPQQYAIELMGANTVTILLDSAPATVYSLQADAEVNLLNLSGTMVPQLSEDYHNLLVYGGMATELDKMEKYDLSAKQEAKYEKRLSEYRLYIAASAYKDIVQGKNSADRTPRSVPLV